MASRPVIQGKVEEEVRGDRSAPSLFSLSHEVNCKHLALWTLACSIFTRCLSLFSSHVVSFLILCLHPTILPSPPCTLYSFADRLYTFYGSAALHSKVLKCPLRCREIHPACPKVQTRTIQSWTLAVVHTGIVIYIWKNKFAPAWHGII